MDVVDWAHLGNCAGRDPEAMFVRGALQQQAKKVCVRCPVRKACLAYALNTRTEFGVWGGLTERERRALLARHPDIRDWAEVLARSESALARTG